MKMQLPMKFFVLSDLEESFVAQDLRLQMGESSLIQDGVPGLVDVVRGSVLEKAVAENFQSLEIEDFSSPGQGQRRNQLVDVRAGFERRDLLVGRRVEGQQLLKTNFP